MQRLMKSGICFPLGRAPRSALIDEPMLHYRSAAETSFRGTLLDDLEITIAKFLVPIFHPKTRSIHYVSQFLRVVRQEAGGFDGERAGDQLIMKTRL